MMIVILRKAPSRCTCSLSAFIDILSPDYSQFITPYVYLQSRLDNESKKSPTTCYGSDVTCTQDVLCVPGHAPFFSFLSIAPKPRSVGDDGVLHTMQNAKPHPHYPARGRRNVRSVSIAPARNRARLEVWAGPILS